MVNGVPRFEFVAAPAGKTTTYISSTGASVTVSNLKLNDSDIIAIGADDFGDPTNDPYSQLPINYVPFSLGAGVRDNNYLAFDHPNGARGFVAGRQSVDGVTSNYIDFSNPTPTQLNPNGGLGLTIYLYDAVTGLNSTFRIATANVGLLSDDPTTPVVEAKVPLLNNPYVPNQDIDQPNAQQVRSKPSTLLNTAQKDQQEKNRARTQEKRDLAKTTRTLLDDSYPNP
jgi:hypothetical protein